MKGMIIDEWHGVYTGTVRRAIPVAHRMVILVPGIFNRIFDMSEASNISEKLTDLV